MHNISAVVIGGSAGSLNVILEMLPLLKADISFSILLVLHRLQTSDSKLTEIIKHKSPIPVLEVEEKMPIEIGNIYLAPADYHVLIESNKTFSLDYSEKVNFSRPSIDVSFQAASEVFNNKMIGVLLSGSSIDGVSGLKSVAAVGGIVWIQNPKSTHFSYMPEHAARVVTPHQLIEPNELSSLLNHINTQ